MSDYDPQLALRQTIAQEIDWPSVYMGGPSRQGLKIAGRIIERLRADERLLTALKISVVSTVRIVPALRDQADCPHAATERGRCEDCGMDLTALSATGGAKP